MLVLNFHGIAQSAHGLWVCSDKLFLECIGVLESRGYTFRSLQDYDPDTKTEKQCAITFDDGRKGIERVAIPSLVERGIPATIFVVTSFASGGPAPLIERYTDFLSWDDLLRLTAQGVRIGSHGVAHLPAYLVPRALYRDELTESLRVLEQRLPTTRTFAAPYGQITRELLQDAQAAGYEKVLSADSGWNKPITPRLRMRRLSLLATDTLAGFSQTLDQIERARFTTRVAALIGQKLVRTDLDRLSRLNSYDAVLTDSNDDHQLLLQFAVNSLYVERIERSDTDGLRSELAKCWAGTDAESIEIEFV